MANVNIKGIDKAKLLAALYDNARPLGMGMLHYTPEPMGIEHARGLLEETGRFDYVAGRPLKVRLDGDELDTWLYDRDQGAGEGERIVAQLRQALEVG